MKRKTANKALSLLLTLCMVIGLLPGMTLTASAEEGTHDHSSSEWTALPASGGPLAAGKYYLSDDLTLTNNLGINGQNVTICLNGHVLTGKSNDYYSVIRANGGTLTICDCGSTEHKGSLE